MPSYPESYFLPNSILCRLSYYPKVLLWLAVDISAGDKLHEGMIAY